MREEINRILKLVEAGELTGDQAAQMIDAITGAAGASAHAGQPWPGESRRHTGDRERRHHGGHRRHGQRRRDHGRHRRRGFEDLGDLGIDIEAAVNFGADAMRRAWGDAMRGGSASGWGASNSIMFSKCDAPEGKDFRVEDNQLVVSQVVDLRLDSSEFRGNQLNAAGIGGADLRGTEFADNGLRGSSLKEVRAEGSRILANQLNGVQIAKFTLADSAFRRNSMNATQFKDVGLADSRIRSSQFNAARLRSVMLKGETNVKTCEFSAVRGRDWVLDAARLDEVKFKGISAAGLIVTRTRLTNCTWMGSWAGSMEASVMGRGVDAQRPGHIRDFTLEDVELEDCEFVDCRFDRTAIRGVKAKGLRFDDVDFSGLTITSTDQFAGLANARAA
ncbi:MAG: hypothetical protein F4Y26_08740 [Gammaproteobacteria bacterium]|nr:hypothetical protein [Gammaproteobacteria bacterium]